MAEKKSQSLGFLLRDYWTGIINGIGKSNDVGGKFDYFKDSKERKGFSKRCFYQARMVLWLKRMKTLLFH